MKEILLLVLLTAPGLSMLANDIMNIRDRKRKPKLNTIFRGIEIALSIIAIVIGYVIWYFIR